MDELRTHQSGCEYEQGLPVEVWDHILASIDSKSDLKACALISRGFCHLARYHLFREVFVSSSNAERFADLLKFLETSPHIAACIRELSLGAWKEGATRYAVSIGVHTLSLILHQIPQLQNLELLHVSFEQGATPASLDASPSDSLPQPLNLEHLHLAFYAIYVDMCCSRALLVALYLFGDVKELAIDHFPPLDDDNMPELPDEPDWDSEDHDFYYSHVIEAVAVQSHLRVQELKIGEKVDTCAWIFFIKALQASPSVSTLTAIHIKCDDFAEAATLMSLLRVCGSHIRECSLDISRLISSSSQEGLWLDSKWNEFSLSHCTTLEVLHLRCSLHDRVHPCLWETSVTPFMHLLSSTHASHLQMLCLEFMVEDEMKPDLLVANFRQMHWAKLHTLLVRFTALRNVQIAFPIRVRIGSKSLVLDREKLLKDVNELVEHYLPRYTKSGILKVQVPLDNSLE